MPFRDAGPACPLNGIGNILHFDAEKVLWIEKMESARSRDDGALYVAGGTDLSCRMRLALEHVVSAQREPDYSPHLFFDIAFVAQFGDCHARQ